MRSLVFFSLSLCLSAADAGQLFNGKDLSGWKMLGPGQFAVENGMLKTVGGMGLLYYEGHAFGNQTVHVVFKTNGPADNSGVFIRMPESPSDPWYGVHNGYEVQIDGGGDDWHCTGAIYSLSKATARPQKNGEWNTMDIRLDGNKTTILVNGQTVNEFVTTQEVPPRKQWYEPVRGPRPDFGYIGLQNHDARSTVYFKEISVTPAEAPGSLSQDERNRAMSELHASRKQFIDATAGLTPEQWKFKAGPDRWSIAEVSEHIALAEDRMTGWVQGALAHPSPNRAAGNKPPDEALLNGMRDRSKKFQAPENIQPSGRWASREAILDHFQAARDRNIQFVAATPQPLRQVTLEGPAGAVDAYQVYLMIAAHTQRHVAQIEEVKNAAGYPTAKSK